LIHAIPTYANFTVASTANEDDNAETRLAAMPTVVVETAFHTNPNDALALQNTAFRTAAMKGVEKGYRLNAEGKTICEPFKITSIPNVVEGGTSPTLVQNNYAGYPQFPVTRKSQVVSCSGSMNCKAGTVVFQTKTPSPLVSSFTCGASAAGTGRYRVTLVDADGVTTNPVEVSITCKI
jgi:hypothetical protein